MLLYFTIEEPWLISLKYIKMYWACEYIWLLVSHVHQIWKNSLLLEIIRRDFYLRWIQLLNPSLLWTC